MALDRPGRHLGEALFPPQEPPLEQVIGSSCGASGGHQCPNDTDHAIRRIMRSGYIEEHYEHEMENIQAVADAPQVDEGSYRPSARRQHR